MNLKKATTAAVLTPIIAIFAIIFTASPLATNAWQLNENNIPAKAIDRVYHSGAMILEYQKITSVSPAAFKILKNYSSIKVIILSDNLLTNITTVMFNATELNQVSMMNLYGNKINKIEDFSFSSLKNASSLDLGSNQLTQINRNTFAGLVNLFSLNLGGNRIAFIEPLAFVHFSKTIHAIHLSNNYLVEFDWLSLQKNSNSKLDELDLTGNLIGGGLSTKVKLNFTGSRLKKLKLDNNKLTRIDAEVLRPLANLKYFSLGYNNLRLDGNQLGFDYLTKVEEFVLTGNNCTRIGAYLFKGMASLRELDMAGNGNGQVVFLHDSIFDMNLEYLNLCFMKFSMRDIRTCERINTRRTSTAAKTTTTTKKTNVYQDLNYYFEY
jgi:Leucine-rich repeat (LRR) protein